VTVMGGCEGLLFPSSNDFKHWDAKCCRAQAKAADLNLVINQ